MMLAVLHRDRVLCLKPLVGWAVSVWSGHGLMGYGEKRMGEAVAAEAGSMTPQAWSWTQVVL